jgi:hypothetical protein
MKTLYWCMHERLPEPHYGSGQGRTDGRCAERAHCRDGLCLLVGCMLTVVDEAPSVEERQQSLDGCIDLLRCTKDRLRPLCTGVNYVQFGLDEAGCGGFAVIPRRLIGTWLDIGPDTRTRHGAPVRSVPN